MLHKLIVMQLGVVLGTMLNRIKLKHFFFFSVLSSNNVCPPPEQDDTDRMPHTKRENKKILGGTMSEPILNTCSQKYNLILPYF